MAGQLFIESTFASAPPKVFSFFLHRQLFILKCQLFVFPFPGFLFLFFTGYEPAKLIFISPQTDCFQKP